MIENFNGVFFLVIHIIVLIMISFYLIRILFAPSGITEEFGVDKSGIYFARIMGTFIAPLFIIGTYIIFRDGGPAGCWIWYATLAITSVLQLGYESSFYYKKIDALYTILEGVDFLDVELEEKGLTLLSEAAEESNQIACDLFNDLNSESIKSILQDSDLEKLNEMSNVC